MPTINIVETKTIIRAIRLKYKYDFSNYSLNSLRYKIDKIMHDHHARSADILITRILDDEAFFDEFLHEISFSSTELFRDPGMWKALKIEILPQIPGYYIWFPYTGDGNELYSFLILTRYGNLFKNLKIIVSCSSEKSISLLSNGYFNNHTMDTGLENFQSIYPDNDVSMFFQKRDNELFFNSPFLKNVEFMKQNLTHSLMPLQSDLIIFRNRLLDYTSEHQNIIMGNLIENLSPGGYLIIGVKENISAYVRREKSLKEINKNEKIYKKISNT